MTAAHAGCKLGHFVRVSVMSFFEPPPPSPEPPDVYRQPPWLGPPRNVLGAVVALELLVAQSDLACPGTTSTV